MFRIKICGITTPEDGAFLGALGVDAVGLNFYPLGSRYLSPSVARAVLEVLPRSVNKVGVFVNSENQAILNLLDEVPLDWVQLHGDESIEQVRALIPLLWRRDVGLIRVLRCQGTSQANQGNFADFEQTQTMLLESPERGAFLIDAASQKGYGGTGERADWSQAQALVQRSRLPVILAGGLNPGNVATAITTVGPWGVDAANGIEDTPGHKNRLACELFLTRARAAFGEQEEQAADLPGG